MKALQEFIETEKSKFIIAELDTVQTKVVLERLGQEDFALTEYDIFGSQVALLHIKLVLQEVK